ncbi:potassium channel family protein [Haloterrigena salinisoli]|uniref:potassium channel family protein n=1 Tax=Haloterrigena salinisoli TaxID=3132747 RepID=UPI0030D1B051
MQLTYLTFGVLILLITVSDLLWTTLWIEGGAGPLTSQLMGWTWRVLRRISPQNPRLLSLSGPIVFVLSLTIWIVLLWSGWTLIFAGAGSILVDTLNRGPISWYDRIYYTGYTIFTLGTGDFVSEKGPWQIVTILATGSGMLFVTLTATYIISVLDAVTQKRAFASNVSGIGTQSEEIVRTSWNGEEFQGLDLPLNTFVTQLTILTENHKAYPILHYFHSAQTDRSPVIEITVLDEALTLLRFGIPEQHQPDEIILQSARASVDNYLETLNGSFVKPADSPPSSPDLGALRKAGLPTVSDEDFEMSLQELDNRRRMLLGLVNSDSRQWPSETTD